MKQCLSLMIQGTGSHVGKSVVVAALGRIFSDMGYRVAPFKAQNMALNSAVVGSGARQGEIGRSQALQAQACRAEPSVDMNPVLLKPGREGCQIILQGKVWGANTAREYGRYPEALLDAVRTSYRRLTEQYEIVLIEGAGSSAEVNLLDRDLPNHWIARESNAPVLVVGNIDCGGVFASLLGTWMIVPEPWRIRGFVLNQFRGDASLLGDATHWLQRRTGVPTLGVIPWLPMRLPEEDSVGVPAKAPVEVAEAHARPLRIAVLRLPHLSNFTDFDALARQPGVALRYVWTRAELDRADVIILPGTRSTVADLEALRREGLDAAILCAAGQGRAILGICGGYQMLGRRIFDPDHIEAAAAETPGLGLLPVETHFLPEKRTERGQFRTPAGATVAGYFIQHGRVQRSGGVPLLTDEQGQGHEGCRAGNIVGTSLHGALTADGEASSAPGALLQELMEEWQRNAGIAAPDESDHEAADSPERELQRWSEHVRRSLDLDRIFEILRTPVLEPSPRPLLHDRM